MTDLPVYPDSYLSAPIVKKQKVENGWTICVLESGKFIYFDRFGIFFEITKEHLKWNQYWNARMENQGVKDIALFAESRNSLSPQSIETILQFMETHKTQAA